MNDFKYTPPWWVLVISTLLKIITIIFVPVVVVAIVQHRNILDVFMRLLERLSMLL